MRKAVVLSFFWVHIRNLEERVRRGDQAGNYEHLNAMNLEDKDENINSLRDVKLNCERFVRWFQSLLNTTSKKLDSDIAEGLN